MNNAVCLALCRLSVTSSTTHKQSGSFWCRFPCGWVCVCSGTLWVSPTNSPVRLEVPCTAASTSTGVFSQRFEALFSCTGAPGLLGLFCSPFVPPGISVCECGTARSTSFCLAGSSSCSLLASCRLACPTPQSAALLGLPATILPALVLQPLPCHESSLPNCPSPPLLLVWMNVSSLTPWLLDSHTVRFSVSFLFCFVFKSLLSFSWLYKEAQCVYLCLHLDWKSPVLFFFFPGSLVLISSMHLFPSPFTWTVSHQCFKNQWDEIGFLIYLKCHYYLRFQIDVISNCHMKLRSPR